MLTTRADVNNEPLPFASVFVKGTTIGGSTDFDGNYSINISSGERNIKVSYVGYKQLDEIVIIGTVSQKKNFKLETILLNEVQVVSDIARDRQTPVAFSIFFFFVKESYNRSCSLSSEFR